MSYRVMFPYRRATAVPVAPRFFSLPARPLVVSSQPAEARPPFRLAPVVAKGQPLPSHPPVLQPKLPATLFHSPSSRREESAKDPGTALPVSLKMGVERLSGLSMDGVRVHYNSPAPRALNALAFTRGTEVHVAPGQERHLAHETWHVVQQMEGRVRPTIRLGGVGANDDPALEREAEAMGARAGSGAPEGRGAQPLRAPAGPPAGGGAVQRFPVTASWGPVDRYKGGSWMKAEVGADDEWHYGSKPRANTPSIITKVGKIVGGKRRYIAGHLLNDNMGGKGVNKNLTVLTSNANKKQTGVEAKVKKLATKAAQIKRGSTAYGDPDYDHGVKYKVEVLGPAPAGIPPYNPVNERKLASGLRFTITPIRKDQHGTISPWTEEAGSALRNYVVNNVPPYPKVPEKGKPSPQQKLIRDVLAALADPKGSTSEEIQQYFNTSGIPGVKRIRFTLKKGEEKQLWKKHRGRYKLLA